MADSYIEISNSSPSVVEVDEDILEVVIDDSPRDVLLVEESPDVEIERVEIEVISVGTQGPQGPPGPGDGTLSYYHTQASVSDTWVITHNMAYRPNVMVFNSANDLVEGSVVHDSANQMTVSFSDSFSGYAVLS